jgi:quinol monooxygenase YgiN
MPVLHTAHLRVRVDVIEPFRTRLMRHADISLEREKGCHRFDVFQDRDDPTLFLLVEIYEDNAALEIHRTSQHYLAFREDVREWVIDRKWWFWVASEQNQERGSS